MELAPQQTSRGRYAPGQEGGTRAGEQRAEHLAPSSEIAPASSSSKAFHPPTPELSSATSKSRCMELLRAGVGGNSVQGAISRVTSPGVHMVSHAGGGKGMAELIWTMHSKRKALFLLILWIKCAVQGLQRVHIKYPTSTVVLPVPVTFSVL